MPPRKTLALLLVLASTLSAQDAPRADRPIALKPGDRICLIGNTFAERMLRFGTLETALHRLRPDLKVTVRNLAWSADEVALQPRPLNFGAMEEHLERYEATVIIACFGINESYRGDAGLAAFEDAYRKLAASLAQKKFDGKTAPRLLLVGPIAHELHGPPLPDRAFVDAHNASIAKYDAAIARIAHEQRIGYLGLYEKTRSNNGARRGPRWTRNGIHLDESGYRRMTPHLLGALGIPVDATARGRLTDDGAAGINKLVVEKNNTFFHRYRPVNGEYVYGRRARPFGVVSFPPEMALLDRMVSDLDARIHALAGALPR